MKITFFSNFLSPHQVPFSLAMTKNKDIDYHFVATSQLPKKRRLLGYPDEDGAHGFCLAAYGSAENREKALELARTSDVILIGSAPKEYSREGIAAGAMVLRYSERLFKDRQYAVLPPKKFAGIWLRYLHTAAKPVYLLCASAYTAADYAKAGAFGHKAYKWGYFPQTRHYELQTLMDSKQAASLLWCGRLIRCKHPELAVKTAARLRREGVPFTLKIIGNGELEQPLRRMIDEEKLSDCVFLLGAMSPEQVREQMEQAQIFLFPSDFHEGWGAVLNESMNSGCAVVASHAPGSVPYLLKNGENGLIYENGDEDAFYRKVRYLLEHPQRCRSLGANAYRTITELWNAETAAQRLLCLIGELKRSGRCELYADGPCSPAQKLKNNWFEEAKNAADDTEK